MALFLAVAPMQALRLEKINFGDFSNWVTRDIKESAVLGGKVKTVYAIGPAKHIRGNVPYTNQGGSPWATSNVYAKVSGVVKASNTVSPAMVGGNRMAKLSTKMEEVKVLGIINLDVMVPGTIFLGTVREPISSTSDPFRKLSMGIPYTKRPKALVYDIRVDMPNVNTRIKSTGFGPKKTLKGRDKAEVYVMLQKRWGDAKGNIYAHRVGTGRERYSSSVPLKKGHVLPIHYGDITKTACYKPYMRLLDGENAYYAYNSKGKLKPVHEVGWAPEGTVPTHVLVMFSSTCGEPFVGTEGLDVYVDNVAFGF